MGRAVPEDFERLANAGSDEAGMMLILTGEGVTMINELAVILKCEPNEVVGFAIQRLWKERFRVDGSSVAD
jgi:hypothetical protein